MLAYIIAAVTVAVYINAVRQGAGLAKNTGKGATILVTMQIFLGIITLVYQAPLGLSAMHQTVAALIFCVAVWHAHELRRS